MKKSKLNMIEVAKLNGFLGMLIGIIAGVIYSVGGLLLDSLVSLNIITSSETPGLSIGTAYAFGALIGMPIIFALGGFLFGLLGSHLYNIYTKYFMGIKIDI